MMYHIHHYDFVLDRTITNKTEKFCVVYDNSGAVINPDYEHASLIIKANGKLMVSCDTTIISGTDVEITLEKSKRKGESFKIYYRKGIRMAGSLKNAKVSKDGKLTNLEKGFYTLYIVTQNKETYLTYLYINK